MYYTRMVSTHPPRPSLSLPPSLRAFLLPSIFSHSTQAGEAVEFQMVQGDKGRKAINVTGPGGEVLPPRSNSDRPYTPRGEGESSGPRE